MQITPVLHLNLSTLDDTLGGWRVLDNVNPIARHSLSSEALHLLSWLYEGLQHAREHTSVCVCVYVVTHGSTHTHTCTWTNTHKKCVLRSHKAHTSSLTKVFVNTICSFGIIFLVIRFRSPQFTAAHHKPWSVCC